MRPSAKQTFEFLSDLDWRPIALMLACLTAAACYRPQVHNDLAFVGQVWTVTDSEQVHPGSYYAFIPEGTLVTASDGNLASLGQWSFKNGKLTMVEDGRPYNVEILEQNKNSLKLRINGPGEPVEMTLAPAGGKSKEEKSAA